MTDQPPPQVRFARRFVAKIPGQPDIHGIEFPSGIVLYDHPSTGLEAATSIDHIRDLTEGATIHWADEQYTPNDGPSVQECAAVDRNWDIEKAGE